MVIVLGALCLAVMPSVILMDYLFDLGGLGWPGLVSIYAVQGIGRSVWEGVFKAQWASRFGKSAPGAFANLIVQFGSSSIVAYLLLPNLPLPAACAICIMIAALSAICFSLFECQNRARAGDGGGEAHKRLAEEVITAREECGERGLDLGAGGAGSGAT